jgi:hypothetical protein
MSQPAIKKPPYKRSITPQDIRAMRDELPPSIPTDKPLLTEAEAEALQRRIPSPPPAAPRSR